MVKQCAAPLRDKWEAAARSPLKFQCVKHCQLAVHKKTGQKPPLFSAYHYKSSHLAQVHPKSNIQLEDSFHLCLEGLRKVCRR